MHDGTNPERLDKIGRFDRGKSLHGKIGRRSPTMEDLQIPVVSSKAFSIAAAR
jgi:hypothetical protein